MKKILLMLSSIILLVGCGNIDGSEITSEIQERTTEESTEEIGDIEQETNVPAEAEIYEDLGGGWVVERQVFTVPATEAVTENLAERPMPVWSPEYFQYETTDTGLNVYKTLNVLGERGELHQQLEVDIETPSDNIKDIVIILDYDGDSYHDIAVRTKTDDKNTYYRYFHYNPDTDYFEEWQELDKLNYFASPYGNGLSVFRKTGEFDGETDTYVWKNDSLVLVRKEKQYLDDGLTFREYLEYDENGNETLAKRENLVYDDDGSLISVTDVTP
ncbi:MAG: hypothetical protein K2I00_03890 [Ruminococcus sp.]|nr:hypothetical protein [Ruminococcus sp.]